MRICVDEQKVCAKFRDGDGQFPNIERTIPFSPCLLYLSAPWYTFECVVSLFLFPFVSFSLCHFIFVLLFLSPPPAPSWRIAWTTRDRVRLKRKLCQTLPRRNQPLATWDVLRTCPSQFVTKTRVSSIANNAHAQLTLFFSLFFSLFLSLGS